MKKIILTALIGITILAVSGVVSATMIIPANEQARQRAMAPEKSSAIGETESGEWSLDRVDFIHYARPANPGKLPKTETCYKLMGVKWTALPVSYVINPTNPQNLTADFISSAIFAAAETWDNATSSELFDNSYAVDSTAQYGVQDYKNAIAFGDYPDSNVIGVTSVWFTRVGKKIVEFDMLLNTDFTWGDGMVDPSVMDLRNIATHELGHAAGLNDIYSTSCFSVTMFGYSSYGETQKTTLEAADIKGIQTLYGAF